MHGLERVAAIRIAATATALDTAPWPDDAIVLRTAGDEALVLRGQRHTAGTTGGIGSFPINDEHTIIAADTSLCGVWIEHTEALSILERECEWELPSMRPAFAQGAVAGLPMKLWFERDRVLFVVAAPFAADFAERIR